MIVICQCGRSTSNATGVCNLCATDRTDYTPLIVCAVPGQECAEFCVYPNGCNGITNAENLRGENDMEQPISIISNEVKERRAEEQQRTKQRAEEVRQTNKKINRAVEERMAEQTTFAKRIAHITTNIILVIFCVTLVASASILGFHILRWLVFW